MTATTPRGVTYPVLTDQVATLGPTIQDMALDLDSLVQQLVDRLDAAAHRPAARIAAVTDQLLTPFVANTITFTGEDFDTGGMADIATAPTRLRLTEQGIYVVGASLALTPFTGTWGARAVLLNSTSSRIGAESGQGSNLAGGDPQNGYLCPSMVTYADGVTPSDITVSVTSTANGNVNVQSRSLWAVKISNVSGGY